MVDAIRPVASREVYRNPWLTLRVDDVVFAGGAGGEFAVVEKGDFALVLPYADGGFWLVEQYRYPMRRRSWEFPQGAWGADGSGTAEQLAHAELREETGLRAERLDHLGRLASAPGHVTNSFDAYLATGLTAGAPEREATEADMVHAFVAEDELIDMIRTGAVIDSNSVAALLLLRLWRDGRPS
ncbi:MAG: NUDIX domain-containing protein [Jatrophihabitantaceae bacterium]